MKSLGEDIRDWLAQARDRLQEPLGQLSLERRGIVFRIGDGVATVVGLSGTRLNEVLRFKDGPMALAVSVSAGSIDCVLLEPGETVAAGTWVYGTGEVVHVPVGEALLGRVVDPLGRPLDDKPLIREKHHLPIERQAPGIVDRQLVSEPLMTGITVVDAMIPLGRGQRELIIGDRKVGKTSLAVDAMINQRDTGVVCIYAAIGQKTSSTTQVIEAVTEHGALGHSVFVVGEADAMPGAQWLTPYAACTIAEYFRDQGQDALLILDDLTKHAIVHRQISLLLRNPPGREAYPGDVFYLHARLLERAAKLSDALGGGSMTALAIAETQGGNLTAYIPTNLISITDGQIYLEPKLFYEGQKPAVNVGMSVSRVGGQSQAPAMRRMADKLRLEYMQFLELEVFTRFGAMLDEQTRGAIQHGERIRAVLRQTQHQPLSLTTEVALLLAVNERKLDEMSMPRVEEFKRTLQDWLESRSPQIVDRLERTRELSDQDMLDLLASMDQMIDNLNETEEVQD